MGLGPMWLCYCIARCSKYIMLLRVFIRLENWPDFLTFCQKQALVAKIGNFWDWSRPHMKVWDVWLSRSVKCDHQIDPELRYCYRLIMPSWLKYLVHWRKVLWLTPCFLCNKSATKPNASGPNTLLLATKNDTGNQSRKSVLFWYVHENMSWKYEFYLIQRTSRSSKKSLMTWSIRYWKDSSM